MKNKIVHLIYEYRNDELSPFDQSLCKRVNAMHDNFEGVQIDELYYVTCKNCLKKLKSLLMGMKLDGF